MRKARLFSLLLLLALAATGAHADSFKLTINFNPPSAYPSDPCFGTTCTLGGSAQFYLMTSGPNIDGTITTTLGDPIAVSALAGGQSLSAIFTPGDPCFGLDAFCTLGLSFLNGGTTVGKPPNPNFATFFFLSGDTIPSAYPNPPPILPLGTLGSNLYPEPPPISQSGPIVAYDAPITVGDWSVEQVPEPAPVLLMISGLACLVPGRRKLGGAGF